MSATKWWSLFQKLSKSPNFPRIVIVLSILIPFLFTLKEIALGNIAFWGDPARDLLLAADNLRKISLIGPTSGIPGIFYGPHWIWAQSMVLLFSKDPRVVVFITLTIPYFVLFPLVLFRFSKLFTWQLCLVLWVYFIISFQQYTMQLWSIHPAPLIILIIFYLLSIFEFSQKKMQSLFFSSILGFLCGFLINFHISLGIAIFSGIILYLLLDALKEILSDKSKWFAVITFRFFIIVAFFIGAVFAFLPTILFELRHDFFQTQKLIAVIVNSWLYNSAATGQVGLEKDVVLQMFLGKLAEFLQILPLQAYLLYSIFIAWMLREYRLKRLKFSRSESRLLLAIFSTSLATLFIYLTSKNPVWSYHFVGVETIALLFVGIFARKQSLFSKLLVLWVGILIVKVMINNVHSFFVDPNILTTLSTKKSVVKLIYTDADSSPFSALAYDPGIYTYDYDYLFWWLGKDVYHMSPLQDVKKSKFVYLILPRTDGAAITDFINYKTPNSSYATVQTWTMENRTVVLKRQRIDGKM